MSAGLPRNLHALPRGPQWQLISGARAWDADALEARIAALAAWLRVHAVSRVASQLDNGDTWCVLDLALRRIGATHVPLPTFFSHQQVRHALRDSGAQCAVVATGAPPLPGFATRLDDLDDGRLACWQVESSRAAVPLPAGTAIVTYTSGTTGQPKGVCLGEDLLGQVVASLVDASSAVAPRRHLCLMPLSTLLENVAGLYAALACGADLVVPPLAEIGYTGAAGLHVPTLLECLHRTAPQSVILVPQLLLALVMAAEAGAPLPASLRYIAVGGGHVGANLLSRARALGLPVFEGYGLTECGSVVALNRPGATRDGSVGRVLPHARISIEDGELCVHGAKALGVLGQGELPDGPLRTGDLGHVDADGFVFITGRRKHVFITAFGRNVSPEWVESELLAQPAIAQAVVWGEARADNVAVVVPRQSACDDTTLHAAVAAVNAALPDYARVSRLVRAEAPFTAAEDLLTANGRPRRAAILARYAAAIDAAYRAPAPPALLPLPGVAA